MNCIRYSNQSLLFTLSSTQPFRAAPHFRPIRTSPRGLLHFRAAPHFRPIRTSPRGLLHFRAAPHFCPIRTSPRGLLHFRAAPHFCPIRTSPRGILTAVHQVPPRQIPSCAQTACKVRRNSLRNVPPLLNRDALYQRAQ